MARKKLTAAAVEKAKPHPTRRREIRDGDTAGLYLVVQTSGHKSWCVRYRIGRRPIKYTLKGFPSLVEARKQARNVMNAVDSGKDPHAEKKAERRRELEQDDFEAVARSFIEKHCIGKRDEPHLRRWRDVARILGLKPLKAGPKTLDVIPGGLVARWGDRKIGSIVRGDVVRWQDGYEDTPILGNRALAHVRKLFAWALERDLVAVNPCSGIKPRAPEVSRDRVLSDNELLRIWNAADGDGYGAIVRVLILTGQRREEVGAMRWSELDLDKRLWTLPPARTKNKQWHTVPLSDAVIDIIKAQPRIHGSDFVFTLTGRTPINGFSRGKRRLDEISGVVAWRLHDIRRTVASGMAALGISLPVIEKVLNHKSGSFAGIVSVYQRHDFSGEKRAALEAWARYVTSLDRPVDNVVELKREERIPIPA
jgi:integrase